MTAVVGVDGARRRRWVAVSLVDGRLDAFAFHATFAEVLAANPDAGVVGIDIPIGHEGGPRRSADAAAQAYLGRAASTIFPAPQPEILALPDHALAVAAARGRGWPAPSAQAWALRARILEVAAVADARVVEVHPECSFRALAGEAGPLAHGKHSWAGLHERLDLLHRAGLRPTRSFGGAGKVGPDDVLDATAAAWSAARVARKEAFPLPADPPRDPRTGRAVAIWV